MSRRLSPRERRVVTLGVGVSASALLFAFGVLPMAQRWGNREALIDLRTEQLARLRGVVSVASSVRNDLEDLERERARAAALLLPGGTVPVAASNLQLLLNRYVSEAGLELDRVDAVGRAVDLGTLQRIPARMTVRGEIRSLVHLLARMHGSDPFLTVDELRVTAAPEDAAGAQTLTALVTVAGYARAAEVEG